MHSDSSCDEVLDRERIGYQMANCFPFLIFLEAQKYCEILDYIILHYEIFT